MRAFAIGTATILSLVGVLFVYYFVIPVPSPSVPQKLLRLPDPFPRPYFSGPVDGLVRVKGEVLEWLVHPLGKSSVAYIDEQPTTRASTIPLRNATITLFLGWPQREDTLWKTTTTSNEEGLFELGHSAAPGFYNMALVITKVGFSSVRKVFYHGKTDHEATIIMTRSSSKTPTGNRYSDSLTMPNQPPAADAKKRRG